MNSREEQLNAAFYQSISTLCADYNRNRKESALYLQFIEGEVTLYFFSKGHGLKPIYLSRAISPKMLGLGFTADRLIKALMWLREICQYKLKTTKAIGFILFSTNQAKRAIIGVCLAGKHLYSYPLAEVLEQYYNQKEQLN